MAAERSVSLCEPLFFFRCGCRADGCLQLEIEYYVSDPVLRLAKSNEYMNSNIANSTIFYLYLCAVKTEQNKHDVPRDYAVASVITWPVCLWSHHLLLFNDDDLSTAH